MPATFKEAYDDIVIMFNAGWDNVLPDVPPVIWPADQEESPQEGDMYAKVDINQTLRTQQTISNLNGIRRYKGSGEITVQVFVKLSLNDPLSDAQNLAIVVTNSFEGKRSANGVEFFDVTQQGSTRVDGWLLIPINMRFEYSEIR